MSFNFGLILGFTMLFSIGNSTYLCNVTGDKWEQAVENCGNVGGTILTADDLKDMDLSDFIKTNITEFWTSNIIEIAHAVKYEGCYVYSDSVTASHIQVKEINLVNCQVECSHNYISSFFYGLYGGECICIYKKNQLQFLLSNQSCFQNCNISNLESCKNSQLIALYSRIGSCEEQMIRKDNSICSKCVTTTNSTENCSKIMRYHCKETIKNGTFLDAIKECGTGFDSDHGSNDSMGHSWKPVFFPTCNRIQTIDQNQNSERLNRFKLLKLTVCKSLKLSGNSTYLKQRKCADLLPYICRTEINEGTRRYLRACPSSVSLYNMTTQAISTKSDIFHASKTRCDTYEGRSDINPSSTKSYSKKYSTDKLSTFTQIIASESSDIFTTPEPTNNTQTGKESTVPSSTLSDHQSTINVHNILGEARILSTVSSVSLEQINSTGSVIFPKYNNPNNVHLGSTVTPAGDVTTEQANGSKIVLIVGITCGAAAIIFITLLIVIVRKRRSGCKKEKNENGLEMDTIHFNPINDNQEGQDILHNESAVLYSVAVPVNTAPVSSQTNDFYAAVNKNNNTENQNKPVTPVTSAVQSENNKDISGMYAVVTKVKKETANGETSKGAGNDINNPLPDDSDFFTGNYDNSFMYTEAKKRSGNNQSNVSVESADRKESGISYSLSSGADYDHLDLSGNTGVLPVESDALYDHAAPGNNDTDDMYDSAQHNIKQHGLNDTYDQFSAL